MDPPAGNGQLTELPEGQLVGCSPRSIMSEDYVAGMSDDEEVQLEPEDCASPEGRVSETGISYTAVGAQLDCVRVQPHMPDPI